MDTFTILIFAIIIIPLLIMALVLLSGRGAFLISGYNRLKPEQKARYDEKALCRFTGKLLLATCLFLLMLFGGIWAGLTWLSTTGVILLIAGTLLGVLYAGTGQRFRRSDSDDDSDDTPQIGWGGSKKTKMAVIIVTIVVLGGCGILFFYGEREPVVEVLANEVQIRAMYGLTVDFVDIASVALLQASMNEIDPGRRTNGFASFGHSLRGHFSSGLLFVHAPTAPTIRIERINQPDIYLSLRDSAQTENLYQRLRTAIY